jgi:hypothetical protein
VLVFVRLRALLCELCADHPVAQCATCHRSYTPEQLGTEIVNASSLCRQCGTDLRESLMTHARTCPNFTPQKPLTRMAPVASATPSLAPSDRFAARRQAKLGFGGHAAVR